MALAVRRQQPANRGLLQTGGALVRSVGRQVVRRAPAAVIGYVGRKAREAFSGGKSVYGPPNENTFQHDVQSLYRYRRMPRRKRRRAIRYKRRVDRVINSRVPVRTFIKTTTQFAPSKIDEQSYAYSLCLGVDVSNDQKEANDDLEDMAAQAFEVASTVNVATWRGRIFIKSVTLETIIRNLSSVLVFFDVYRIYCRTDVSLQDYRNSTTFAPTAAELATTAIVGFEDTPSPSGWLAPRIFNHGVTPFQNSKFCQQFKIVSKTRYRIEPGSTIQLHLQRRVNKTFNYADIRGKAYVRGLTTGYFFLFYGAPGGTAAEGLYSQASSIRIVRNVQYSYRVLDSGAVNNENAFQQVSIPNPPG